MFKLLKKYINFILKNDLKDSSKNYNTYNKDIELYELCSRDPIEFMNKYFQDNMLIKLSLLDMTTKQLIALDSFVNKKKIIVKSKDDVSMFKVQIILTAWLMIFYPNTKIGVIVPNQELAKKYIRDLRNAFDYIKSSCYDSKFFEVTAQSVTLTNNSHCVVRSSRDIDINGLFRGITLDCIFYSDVTHLQCMSEIYDLFLTQYNPEYMFLFSMEPVECKYFNNKSWEWFESKFKENKELHSIDIRK